MSESGRKVLTFLMTDVERSTRVWTELPNSAGAHFQAHEGIVSAAVRANGGRLVKERGEGDSSFSVFDTPEAAIHAAIDLQIGMQDLEEIHVRCGIHTGLAELREGDYFGLAPGRCARIRDLAHGDQVLCSSTVAELAGSEAEDWAMIPVGIFRLAGYASAEHVYQLRAEGLPARFPPPRGIPVVQDNLPATRDRFFGRDAELHALSEIVPARRLVTITGPGGCGKTRLSLELSVRLRERFPDGIWWVDLVALEQGEGIAEHVLSCLPFSAGGASGNADDRLAMTLAEGHRLLVLDNCEHVQTESRCCVEALLESCPSLHVLATGRRSLSLAGETVWRLAPLPLPATESDESGPAEHLFLDRAGLAGEHVDPISEPHRYVADLCRVLDGLPLAIEIVASLAASYSPQQLLTALQTDLSLATSPVQTSHPAHVSLERCVEWSVSRLEPELYERLLRLSELRSSWDLEAAQAVCGGHPITNMQQLAQLVDRSLIVAEPDITGVKRYHMLDTVGRYARRRLADTGEQDVVQRRVAEHFLQRGLGVEGAPELAREDLPNLLAGLTIATRRKSLLDLALQAAAVLWRRPAVASRPGAISTAASSLLGDDADPMVHANQAEALIGLGILHYLAADYVKALSVFQRCTTMPSCQAGVLQLRLQGNLGAAQQMLGNLGAARIAYGQALELCKTHGDDEQQARLLLNLGDLDLDVGDTEAAKKHFEAARRLLQREDDAPDLWAHGQTGLARACQDLGEIERARALWEDALKLQQRHANTAGISGCLRGLGCMALGRGELDRALDLHTRAVSSARQARSPVDLANALLELGRVQHMRGDQAAAGRSLVESLGTRIQTDDRRGIAEGIALLAAVERARGRRRMLSTLGLVGEQLLAFSQARSEAERVQLRRLSGAARHYAVYVDEAGRVEIAGAEDVETLVRGLIRRYETHP